jgi:hypothetical protein
MLYIKIFLISLIPMLVFSQGYYTEQSKSSFSQLSLNKNGTFSYTEESPIGNLVLNVTGTYKKNKNGTYTGSGWNSKSKYKVILEIYVGSKYAVVSIYGRKDKKLTKR